MTSPSIATPALRRKQLNNCYVDDNSDYRRSVCSVKDTTCVRNRCDRIRGADKSSAHAQLDIGKQFAASPCTTLNLEHCGEVISDMSGVENIDWSEDMVEEPDSHGTQSRSHKTMLIGRTSGQSPGSQSLHKTMLIESTTGQSPGSQSVHKTILIESTTGQSTGSQSLDKTMLIETTTGQSPVSQSRHQVVPIMSSQGFISNELCQAISTSSNIVLEHINVHDNNDTYSSEMFVLKNNNCLLLNDPISTSTDSLTYLANDMSLPPYVSQTQSAVSERLKSSVSVKDDIHSLLLVLPLSTGDVSSVADTTHCLPSSNGSLLSNSCIHAAEVSPAIVSGLVTESSAALVCRGGRKRLHDVSTVDTSNITSRTTRRKSLRLSRH